MGKSGFCHRFVLVCMLERGLSVDWYHRRKTVCRTGCYVFRKTLAIVTGQENGWNVARLEGNCLLCLVPKG